MANNPPDAPSGSYRVIRLLGKVTETVVQATSYSGALAAAMALPPEAWTSRPVYQLDGQDSFEYDVVASSTAPSFTFDSTASTFDSTSLTFDMVS